MAKKIKTLLESWGYAQTIRDIWNAVWPWFPIAWGAATGGAGIMTHEPVMQIMTYAAASAGFGLMVIVFALTLLERRNPENKLTYIGQSVGVDLTKPRSPNAARRIEKAQWMFQIRNDASFPISIIVHEAETDVEDLEPPRTKYPKDPIYIGARAIINVMDSAVELHGRQCGNFTGHAEITLRYGYRGNEKYELKIAGNLQAAMLANGSVTSVALGHTI